MIDLVIRGGRTVLPNLTIETDIAVDGGKIVALGDLSGIFPSKREIDAHGCFVLPGAIDPHVHVNWPFLDATTADDYTSASVAAAFGGCSTVIDFAHPKMGPTPLDRVAHRRAEADGKSYVDYGFHCVLSGDDETALAQMESLVADGVTSFKLYMTYSRRGIMADDSVILKVMKKAAALGALVCVHAENGWVGDANEARFIEQGRTLAIDFPQHKPNYVEAEAVSRAIFWSEHTGCRLYIFHLSTKEGLGLVHQAQQRGVEVVAETCPQYLVLDDSVYGKPGEGHRYICSPPVRSREDCEALWEGISKGIIQVVGTDHCVFTKAQKDAGRSDFTKVPNGLPGIETRLPILFSEGVIGGRISVSTLMRITGLNPARVFGLYPRKGILAPGSDAD